MDKQKKPARVAGKPSHDPRDPRRDQRSGRSSPAKASDGTQAARAAAKRQAKRQAAVSRASVRARGDDAVDPALLDVAARLDWYALLVPPQREFVAQTILRRYGLRTFVPVQSLWRRQNRYCRHKALQRFALLPRYVFVGFEPGEPRWFDIGRLPVVSGVVGIDGAPARLSNPAMVELIERLGAGIHAAAVERHMRTHREFRAGDLVKIVDGPFDGLVVPVVEIDESCAILSLRLFGGAVESVSVRLDILEAA